MDTTQIVGAPGAEPLAIQSILPGRHDEPKLLWRLSKIAGEYCSNTRFTVKLTQKTKPLTRELFVGQCSVGRPTSAQRRNVLMRFSHSHSYVCPELFFGMRALCHGTLVPPVLHKSICRDTGLNTLNPKPQELSRILNAEISEATAAASLSCTGMLSPTASLLLLELRNLLLKQAGMRI